MGCEVTYVPVDGRGLVDPDDVRRALRPNTKLITIMMANNETGVLQPVEEIGKIAAEADVYFHTDAVQAAGKVPIDVKRDRLRSADDLRPQDARAAGRRRAVCAQGNFAASRCSMADATSARAAPEPRMFRALWVWARLRSWRRGLE